MANVVNRTTVEYIKSVNTPDYSPAEWIINPDLSALDDVPHRYWKVVGDDVVEMDQAEKDAVDAAIAEKQHESMLMGRKVDSLPVTILDDLFNEEVYRIGGKVPVKGTLYPDNIVVNAVINAYVEEGDTGTIRVYDATNAQELGTIEFTETVQTLKTLELTDISKGVDVVIEVHGKVGGASEQLHLEGITLVIYR